MRGKDLVYQVIFFSVALAMLLVTSDCRAVQDTVVQKVFVTEYKSPSIYWWMSLVAVVIQAVAGFIQSNKPGNDGKK